MNIIVAGAGKIGMTLVQFLAKEGHDITVIDRRPDRISLISSTLDVITICGNVDIDTLRLAGAADTDLLIAATNSDETNILSCMVARKLGVPHTIARVRQDEHTRETILLRDELGLSLSINPELASAVEISRVLRFPSATKVESFAKGQAELVEFRLSENNPLCGVALKDYHSRFGGGTLICAVRRGNEVFTPTGSFVLQAGDSINVVGSPTHIHELFRSLSIFKRSARNVLIAGGGRISAYLAKQLLAMGLNVKILEQREDRAESIKDYVPKADVVCCDASRPDILEEEGLSSYDAFVALTGTDEINIILSAYAQRSGVDKVVCKVSEGHYAESASYFGLDDPLQPRTITAQQVLRYVRGMENSVGTYGVETLLYIMDGKLEVLEFRASRSSACLGKSIRELPIQQGILIAAIIRNGKCLIPHGDDEIKPDDSVLVITARPGMKNLEDIIKG